MQQIQEDGGGADLAKNITNIWKLLNDINTRVQRLENIVSRMDDDETVYIEPEDETRFR